MASSFPALSAIKPQTRVLLAIFAVVTLALGAAYAWLTRQDYVVMYRDLRPADAAAIVTELTNQGVRYRLADGGRQILAPAQEADAARVGIAGADITMNGIDGFELFNESDMGLTDFAQKIKYQRALQGELARTIMMMDGVVEARVHISMPERTLFRAERQNAEAAVTIATRSTTDQTPARIAGIQRLVAASVPDLAVADVVVLNAHGELLNVNAEAAVPNQSVGPSDARTTAIGDVVRRALPGWQVHVSLEERRTQTLAGDPAVIDTISPAPTPTQIVHVSTDTALNETQMSAVRAALYSANLSGEVIEAVAFHDGALNAEASPTVQPTTLQEQPAAEAPSLPREAPRPFDWILVLIILAMTTVAWLVLWRRPRPSMSDEQQSAFAERLRLGLNAQESGNGRS